MSSFFGEKLKISVFGQSHSEGIGVVIDGLPPGQTIDFDRVRDFMSRRAPGSKSYTTARREEDVVRVLSGLYRGKTCGVPLCGVIENTNVRSGDYEEMERMPRPGHGDYTGWVKYRGAGDIRGGGHFSGRLTAPLCFAGAICLQLLETRGIRVGAHILSVGKVKDRGFLETDTEGHQIQELKARTFPVLDPEAEETMTAAILKVKKKGDSLGGVVECMLTGLPPGIGSPMFDGVENRMSAIIFGIPAVKGIEFGAGFSAAEMYGSQCNDGFFSEETKAGTRRILTETNHHGGVLGGITSGMPVIFRVAFKPTPSIAMPQRTVSLPEGQEETLIVKGRHDPCIVPRAVPVVEAAAALGMTDLLGEDYFRD